MREVKQTTTVKVSKEIAKRLHQDKKEFQRTIGGGVWSINDTIREYIKILDSFRK